MSDYQIGDRPALQVQFTDALGANANPDTIAFTLVDPAGTIYNGTKLDATSTFLGQWKWQIPTAFNKSGLWTFTAVGSDGLNAGGSLVINVGQPTTVQAYKAAELLLWSLTGRRYGTRPVLAEQYRTTACGSVSGVSPFKGSDGYWRNSCGGGCCRIELAVQPVQSVTAVRIHGITTALWTLTGHTLTVEGGCSSCGDCADPILEVDYVAGIPWPTSALVALNELQAEFLAGINGEVCRLPARAVSVARQGVQVQMETSGDLIADGLTGLPISDSFIRSVNPNRLVQRSRVHSVDLPRRVG